MTVEQAIANALAHSGVKGMRWGYRKADARASYLGRVKATHNVNRKIAKGEGTIGDKLLTGSFTKKVAAKNADAQAIHIHHVEMGKLRVRDYLSLYGQMNAVDTAAGFSEKRLAKNLARSQAFSDKRLAKKPRAATAHSDAVDRVLAHHGVKGQKWGVRRNTSATAVSVRTNPAKKRTKIKTSGGANQPAHADAISTRSKQQVLKKSGIASLSNHDLQQLQTRLNLEQNVSRLDKAQRLQGSHFIVRLLKDPAGRKRIATVANSEDGRKVKEAILKKAGKTAVKVGLAAA